MDKKKIAGLIIFAIFIGLLLGYPSIRDGWLKHRVQSAFNQGDFQKTYNLLKDSNLGNQDWAEILILVSEFELGVDIKEIEGRIKELIVQDKLSILQSLVDDYPNITQRFLDRLSRVEGLMLDQKSRYTLASKEISRFLHIPYEPDYQGSLEKAMEIRGESDIVDNIYIRYLVQNGDIDLTLRLYESVSEEFKDDVNWILKYHFIYQFNLDPIYGLSPPKSLDEGKQIIAMLESYGISEELMKVIVQELSRFTVFEQLRGTDFGKRTMYFDYYWMLRKLQNSSTIDKTEFISEFKAREDFKSIEGYEEIVEILENDQIIYKFHALGKDREILYTDVSGNKVYSLTSKEHRELEFDGTLHFITSSPDRNFHVFATSEYGDYYNADTIVILDRNFNLQHTYKVGRYQAGSMFLYHEWLSNDEIGIYDRKINCVTGQESLHNEGENYRKYLSDGYEIYNISDDTTTKLEYVRVSENFSYLRKYTNYIVTTNILPNQHILEIPIGGFDGFLGSCDIYIYVGRVIENTLFVVDAIHKETMERTRLPFFSINWYYWQPGLPYTDRHVGA